MVGSLAFMRLMHVGILVALAIFYNAAASEHARAVNTSKARGDQSGYLWDAQQVYWNWQGRSPAKLIGERNRMPVYAAYLALFYDPAISDDEYFVVAKRWNIRLSLALLAVLAVIFARRLPPLVATNLTLVVAFTYVIFKAGYAQAELLFYFLFFVLFLIFWRLLDGSNGWRRVLLAGAAGALAAIAHLTKAAVIPLATIFLAVFAGADLLGHLASRGAAVAARTAAPHPVGIVKRFIGVVAFVVVFLAVLAPYLINSKRTFGQYFYNVNTTFYAWYDNWASASTGTLAHGDGVGWPRLPADQIPSPAKYWQTHTLGEIAARVGSGFEDMLVRSYST